MTLSFFLMNSRILVGITLAVVVVVAMVAGIKYYRCPVNVEKVLYVAVQNF
jgi:hypothetical protein